MITSTTNRRSLRTTVGRVSIAASIGLLCLAGTNLSHLGGRRDNPDPLSSWRLLSSSSAAAAAAAAAVRGGDNNNRVGGSSSRSERGRDDDDNDDVDPIRRHITKRSGHLWSVWDRKSVLHPDAGTTCNWREFKAAGLPAPPPPPPVNSTESSPRHRAPSFMCLYPRENDIWVSGLIEQDGHWVDCDRLTQLFEGTKGATYVDIGANIGACVMQVLHTTDASVIAFEPAPRNLFHLTSTLLNLPQHMKDRVTLFPVALGDSTTVSAITTKPTNAGNTQLKRSKDEKGIEDAEEETHNIPVERVDDLLGPNLEVDLMKMDVQGFECFVVDGMSNVLKKTQKIMFEVEKDLYERFVGDDACHGARLVKSLQLSNFAVATDRGEPVEDLTGKGGDELKKVEFDFQDMLAEKKRS